MGQHVHARVGGDARRDAAGKVGFEQGAVGGEQVVDQNNLVLAARDDREVGDLGAGAGRCGNGQEIGLGHTAAAAGVQNRLGGIDAGAAAKRDHHVGTSRLDRRDALVHQLLAGIGLDVGIGLVARARRQMLGHLGDHAG